MSYEEEDTQTCVYMALSCPYLLHRIFAENRAVVWHSPWTPPPPPPSCHFLAQGG
jgi:hypothetical protein